MLTDIRLTAVELEMLTRERARDTPGPFEEKLPGPYETWGPEDGEWASRPS